jgi:hypothetical protein
MEQRCILLLPLTAEPCRKCLKPVAQKETKETKTPGATLSFYWGCVGAGSLNGNCCWLKTEVRLAELVLPKDANLGLRLAWVLEKALVC